MSGGYILLVKTPGDGGRVDTSEIWFAHIKDQEKAVRAVEAAVAAAQAAVITVLGTVRHAVLVDQIGVAEGNVMRFESQNSNALQREIRRAESEA